jgi:hypothetical protein
MRFQLSVSPTYINTEKKRVRKKRGGLTMGKANRRVRMRSG